MVQEFTDRAGPYPVCDLERPRRHRRGARRGPRRGGRRALQASCVRKHGDHRWRAFRDETFPELRALGVVPQDDRFVVALHAGVGIRTFAEVREHKPPLKIAASSDDGVNFVGLATHALMAAAGIDATH